MSKKQPYIETPPHVTQVSSNRCVIKPQGHQGTHGTIDGLQWVSVFVTASSPVKALAKAKRAYAATTDHRVDYLFNEGATYEQG